ncbi:MAG: hypothetical protein H7A13_07900 [Pseudomonadales bacterium]|nr:hypothetical protein [Pseudomonadales bacterium]
MSSNAQAVSTGVIERQARGMSLSARRLPGNQNSGLRMQLKYRPRPQRQVRRAAGACSNLIKQGRKGAHGHDLPQQANEAVKHHSAAPACSGGRRTVRLVWHRPDSKNRVGLSIPGLMNTFKVDTACEGVSGRVGKAQRAH